MDSKERIMELLRGIAGDNCFGGIEKITEYLVENGVVALPCKVGDDIFSHSWSIKDQKYEVCAGRIKNVRYDSADGLVTVSNGERYCIWGKTAFHTRESAEAALKAGEPH